MNIPQEVLDDLAEKLHFNGYQFTQELFHKMINSYGLLFDISLDTHSIEECSEFIVKLSRNEFHPLNLNEFDDEKLTKFYDALGYKLILPTKEQLERGMLTNVSNKSN